jgi:hypothetical protein
MRGDMKPEKLEKTDRKDGSMKETAKREKKHVADVADVPGVEGDAPVNHGKKAGRPHGALLRYPTGKSPLERGIYRWT